jgi:hypothetical protein
LFTCSDLDAGDLVDDVPIFTLVEQSDGQFDARGVLLTILDEADANVDGQPTTHHGHELKRGTRS